jgi:Zn-dependent protease with chaperone function
MSDDRRDFSKFGFVKTYILPGVLVFLIPFASLLFFRHAQGSFDAEAREDILKQIEEVAGPSPEKKAAAVAFYAEHPVSELLEHEEFAARMDPTMRFYYATFRWMIRLSAFSIIAGAAVFLIAGACVALSRRSQRAQYWSLSTGWQLLRIYGAAQTVAQGAMVVALSFWVTALWTHRFSVKLVAFAGILAAGAAFAVIRAIFTRPGRDLALEGKVIDRSSSPRLWVELDAVCSKVGAERPDQVVVGVDDNFFVTESPVTVGGKTCRGRTLYVSLSLLKQMRGGEADAVLAHEMAHFSGKDTLYSRKIAPLLARNLAYLQALYENVIARPIFYFMNGFHALFALSMGEQSRSREFRADRIAADATSPRDLAGALLRISAYSDFRSKIQQELFRSERALQAANISAQLEQGFHDHALSFAARPDLGGMETAHPFDSHPPMAQRLEAVGSPFRPEDARELVDAPGDGRWYDAIDDAERIEREQWAQYEEAFRAYHEGTLAYRLLPETVEERAIVVKSFPPLAIEGKKGSLAIDCDGLHYSAWPSPIAFSEVKGMSLHDDALRVDYDRAGKARATIPTKTFGARRQEAIQAVQAYYSRYAGAAAYRKAVSEQEKADAS